MFSFAAAIRAGVQASCSYTDPPIDQA